MNPQPVPPPPLWVSFVPLIVLAVPLLVMTIFLAQRKGKNVAAYVILSFIPGANVLALLWLASQTDEWVTKELRDLRQRLDNKPQA